MSYPIQPTRYLRQHQPSDIPRPYGSTRHPYDARRLIAYLVGDSVDRCDDSSGTRAEDLNQPPILRAAHLMSAPNNARIRAPGIALKCPHPTSYVRDSTCRIYNEHCKSIARLHSLVIARPIEPGLKCTHRSTTRSTRRNRTITPDIQPSHANSSAHHVRRNEQEDARTRGRGTSAALTTSPMVKARSVTSNSPHARVSSRMLSRVTPGRIVPSSGAVTSSFLPARRACQSRTARVSFWQESAGEVLRC